MRLRIRDTNSSIFKMFFFFQKINFNFLFVRIFCLCINWSKHGIEHFYKVSFDKILNYFKNFCNTFRKSCFLEIICRTSSPIIVKFQTRFFVDNSKPKLFNSLWFSDRKWWIFIKTL